MEVSVVWKTVRSWDESYHDDNGRQRCTWDVGDY